MGGAVPSGTVVILQFGRFFGRYSIRISKLEAVSIEICINCDFSIVAMHCDMFFSFFFLNFQNMNLIDLSDITKLQQSEEQNPSSKITKKIFFMEKRRKYKLFANAWALSIFPMGPSINYVGKILPIFDPLPISVGKFIT